MDVGVKVSVQGAEESKRKVQELGTSVEELDKLQQKLHATGTKLREEAEKRAKATKELQQHTQALTEKIQSQITREQQLAAVQEKLTAINDKMVNAVKGLAVAYGVYKVVDYIRDATMLAARYEELGIVMTQTGRTAGYSKAQLEAAAQGMQKMGITMLESREAVVKLVDAQIDLNKATQLARIAQDTAVIGHMNSSEALQRMVYAVQSGSVVMLRHIGINVSFEQAYQKMAKELGVTTNQLSEYDKQQARVNAVIEDGKKKVGIYEEAMTTAGKQIRSMERYTQDFKVVFGSTFNEALVIGVEALTSHLKNANKEVKELAARNELEEWGNKIVDTLAFIASSFIATFNVVRIAGRGIATAAAIAGGPGAVGIDLGKYGSKQWDEGMARWKEAIAGGPAGDTETDRLLNQMNALQRAIASRRSAVAYDKANPKLDPALKQFDAWLQEQEIWVDDDDLEATIAGDLGARYRRSLRKSDDRPDSKKDTFSPAYSKAKNTFKDEAEVFGDQLPEDIVAFYQTWADKAKGNYELQVGIWADQAKALDKYWKDQNKVVDEALKDELKLLARKEAEWARLEAEGLKEYEKKNAEVVKTRDQQAKAELRQINETTYIIKEQKIAALEELRKKYEELGWEGEDALKRVNGELEALRGSTQATGVIVQDVGFDLGFMWKSLHSGLESYLGQVGRWALGMKSSLTSIGSAIKQFFVSIAGSIIDTFAKVAANAVFRWLMTGSFGGAGVGAAGSLIGGIGSAAASTTIGGATGGGGILGSIFGGSSGGLGIDIGGGLSSLANNLLGTGGAFNYGINSALGFTGAAGWGLAEEAASLGISGLGTAGSAFSGLSFAGPLIAGGIQVLQGNVAAGIGTTIGGIAGSYFGPIGTAVGSFLGGKIGGIFGGKKKKKPKPAVMHLEGGPGNFWLWGDNMPGPSSSQDFVDWGLTPLLNDPKIFDQGVLGSWVGKQWQYGKGEDWGSVAPKFLHELGNAALVPWPYASGTDSIISRPTLMKVGEAGSERVTVSPIGAAHNRRGEGNTTIVVQGLSLLDNFAARKLATELRRI